MLQASASVSMSGGELHVDTLWVSDEGQLDREQGCGFGLGKPSARSSDLAGRLVRAINAQAVFTKPSIKTDACNRTYVASDCAVLGRMLNADLKRLGF